ncbi:MAG: ROK family protein [Bacteroidetes bacterium]|jgi:glucokinase|nr:ROK family protein [Bacteroidota bacterium]
MTNYKKDKRIVLTLAAGGTNFVFSALRGYSEIIEPESYPAYAHDLDKSLKTIISAFKKIIDQLSEKPTAISFAFPGPADYPNGIIQNVGNLPAYANGVALGPMLEEIFKMPVFINNDGDLFTFGEAAAGLLPFINNQFYQKGSIKRFHNLFGITLGTGFGGGIVRNNEIYIGDNSNAGEIWIMRDKLTPGSFVEESVSMRAIIRNYKKYALQVTSQSYASEDIYKIAIGEKEGDQNAALKSFELLGESIGEALANAIALLDGLVVIGGGISESYSLFAPTLFQTLNGIIQKADGSSISRLPINFYDLESDEELNNFFEGHEDTLPIPFSNKSITYDSAKRSGIGLSKLGTSKAIAIGAYEFALRKIDMYL